jgi:hypothetical protein
MKSSNVKVDYDIYETLSQIYTESKLDFVQAILQEIRDSGYKHIEPERHYITDIFEPLSEQTPVEEGPN